MKYEEAPEIQAKAEHIAKKLFPHVDMTRVKCFKSKGTSTGRTIARCHGLGKLMQKALNVDATYALEFLSERFDKMSDEEKTKVIIHELMHIPFNFGGGFKHHDWVTDKNINMLYRKLVES
jgi:predicted metallopeptidase